LFQQSPVILFVFQNILMKPFLKICFFRELGLGTNKVYEAGHSLGGIVLETWAKDNADMSTGIILYGSYLANGFGGNGDTNVFPVPVLTAMGSLDGGALSYVTREARESHNPGMIFRIIQYSQVSIIK
jgi:hypothetical protein